LEIRRDVTLTGYILLIVCYDPILAYHSGHQNISTPFTIDNTGQRTYFYEVKYIIEDTAQ